MQGRRIETERQSIEREKEGQAAVGISVCKNSFLGYDCIWTRSYEVIISNELILKVLCKMKEPHK